MVVRTEMTTWEELRKELFTEEEIRASKERIKKAKTLCQLADMDEIDNL